MTCAVYKTECMRHESSNERLEQLNRESAVQEENNPRKGGT